MSRWPIAGSLEARGGQLHGCWWAQFESTPVRRVTRSEVASRAQIVLRARVRTAWWSQPGRHWRIKRCVTRADRATDLYRRSASVSETTTAMLA